MTFDELLAAYPDCGFALYAMEPGGTVTLEIHGTDDEVYTFKGRTSQEAIDAAFPPKPELPSNVIQLPTAANVFD